MKAYTHTLTHSHTHMLTLVYTPTTPVLAQFIKNSSRQLRSRGAKRTSARSAHSYSLTLLKIAPSYMNAYTCLHSFNPVDSFNPVNSFNSFKRLSRSSISFVSCSSVSSPALLVHLVHLVSFVHLVCVMLCVSFWFVSCVYLMRLRCSSPALLVCLVCLVCVMLCVSCVYLMRLRCSSSASISSVLCGASILVRLVCACLCAHIIPLRFFKHVKPVNSFKCLVLLVLLIPTP